MLTEQQLDELWELADKAASGPWSVRIPADKDEGFAAYTIIGQEFYDDAGNDFNTIAEVGPLGGCKRNAFFIAACDPQTIKASIEMARGKK